jgi:hypothetical protein
MGWFGHPIFPLGLASHPNSASGVALATLKGRLGVANATPRALGGGSATP